MLNAVLRMNRFKSRGNQFIQNILQNLLQGVVRLAPIVERTADPDRRSIEHAQPRDLVSIFLSADGRGKCSRSEAGFSVNASRWQRVLSLGEATDNAFHTRDKRE